MIVNILLSFVEGLGTIISPCILPILGFMIALPFKSLCKQLVGFFIGFIVVSSIGYWLSQYINFVYLQWFEIVLLFVFGVVAYSDYLSDKINILIPQGTIINSSSHIIMGLTLGLCWLPCAGPFIAGAMVQIITSECTSCAITTFICYGLGVITPVLIISFFKDKILNLLKSHSVLLRKIFAMLMLISSCFLLYNVLH